MCNPDRCKAMALEVQADLARESEREAKGVSWERFQAVCDELEAAEYEIEALKAKVAELNDLVYLVDQRNEQGEGNVISYKDAFESASPTLTQIRSISANAIREVLLEEYESSIVIDGEVYIKFNSAYERADKLEAGTL